ncbi:MAG: site-specific DNA-methyltransferase [Prevotella sp.]|nr:site-specific DNA-methyltransferase [Prevotella sp.]
MTSEVFNTDCLEYMRTLPDKAFQLAIADTPYGISAVSVEPWKQSVCNPRGKRLRNRIRQGSGKLKNRAIQNMDSDFDFSPPTDEFFQELFRISKNQIIWGGNYFHLPPTRCIICWDKEQPWENFSQFELAWTSFDYPAAMFRYRNTGINEQSHIHPTQKPVELYAYLLRKFAKPGDRIFDPMMGSQSSRIAAYKMGFDYVGCELDAEYFAKGCERFNRECKGEYITRSGHTVIQTQLF